MKLKSLMLRDGIRLSPPQDADIETRAMYTRPIEHFRPESGAEMNLDEKSGVITVRVRGLVRQMHMTQAKWWEPDADGDFFEKFNSKERPRKTKAMPKVKVAGVGEEPVTP